MRARGASSARDHTENSIAIATLRAVILSLADSNRRMPTAAVALLLMRSGI